jgi:Mg-chelatase subunit ChlD
MPEENKSSPVSAPKTSLSTTASADITRKHSVSIPGLHARLRNPVQQAVSDPNTKPNRIALLLDVSGSMQGSKITSLRDACASFVQACNFADTALAIEPFGEGNPPPNRLSLTVFQPLALTTVQMLQSCGSTPMAQAMDFVLNSYSLTRCVLVSDGEPDSVTAAYDIAAQYREAGLPCDCVHIGHSTSGEECLRRIAEMTGGQYIKFTDINSFAKSFKFLTPAYYAMLCDGRVSALDIGAKEIK